MHGSRFIVEQTGCQVISPEQIAEQEKLPESKWLSCYDSWVIIYPGKNGDRWWNCNKLVDQVFEFRYLHLYHWLNMQVKRAIPLFEYMYLNTVAEFIFYQSSAHGAFAPDTLNFPKVMALHGCLQVWLDSHFNHLVTSHPLAARVSMLKRQSLLSGNSALTGGLGHWWWCVWVFLIIQYNILQNQDMKISMR